MQNGEIKRKESLSPPPKREVTWSEYIQSPAGQHPVLGRAPKCKESSRAFKATVAMSEDFPLTVQMLLNVLEVIAPQFKHFQKLRDFIEMKLPPGFPVKVDIPVLPTVSARVTFHDFSWKNVGERRESSSETNGNSTRNDESKVDSNKNGANSKQANG